MTRTGVSDAVGQPLRYTPHDFRRLWATDSVNSGFPVHIAAKLLGHSNSTQLRITSRSSMSS
ncbi:tyrosine-type recombinase/integrase [Rhodococcus erythropolis]|uniref:tyrosine-type recombinase/integrase n=1 Tax=Rhodococcus erythropolis TaxID=1833 RepID=UPI0037A14BF6